MRETCPIERLGVAPPGQQEFTYTVRAPGRLTSIEVRLP